MKKLKKFFVVIISIIILINYKVDYVFAVEGDVNIDENDKATIASHLEGTRVWPVNSSGEIEIHGDGNNCNAIDFYWNVNEVIIIVQKDSNGDLSKYAGSYYKCSVIHITGWPKGTNSTEEFTADEIAEHLKNGTMTCDRSRIYQRWVKIKDVSTKNSNGKGEEVDTDVEGVETTPEQTKKATSTGGEIQKQNKKIKSLKEMIADATSFVTPEKDANGNEPIDEKTFQQGINWLYNIFFAIGMAVAVITGMILGIKFITASVEGKAEIKELLTAYIVGCIVVFGAFGIWKLVLVILSTI